MATDTNSKPQSAKPRRLLSLGTDRLLFEKGSAVAQRIAGYGKDWDEMHIIVAAGRKFQETSIAPNVWIYPTRSRVKAMYPFGMIRLGRFIIARRGITEITCQDPFLCGMAGVALKKETGLPLELQVHTDIGSPNFPKTLGNRLRKSWALSYLSKADTVRVVSNKIKDYLVGTLGISAEKITVRPIFVDTEAVKAAPVTVDLHKKYAQFDKIALITSRLEPEKDIALAVRSWSKVLEAFPKAGLIIVGSGSQMKRLEKLARRLGIARSVIYEGWISDQPTLYSYYKTCDAFLSTSRFEGYGMALVMAKAAGRKIISTDVGVAKEIGAVIAADDPTDLATVIIRALS
jgi:glycosyltransferase involved in cell wall biosynthesis